MASTTVIIADDDRAILTVLKQAMQRRGYDILATDNGRTLLEWVEAGKGDVVVTDVIMPSLSGLDALSKIKEVRPELPVIVISAQNTLMTAVKANELGAYEYLAKPFDLEELLGCVEKSLKGKYLDHGAELSPATVVTEQFELVGRSPAMQEIYRVLARLMQIDLTVLLEGESGTGKELIARALHHLGKRKDKPFIAVNMAAIPRELVESELFGHEKGAFTGAATRKSGKFEQAEGGTLFLDEIGDMPLDAQTKLLRVLQQGEFTPVGGHRAIRTDLRIICATHRDLKQLVTKGEFREDLFYRLNVVPLRVPPLRERREDIPALAEYFLRKSLERGFPRKTLTQGAIRRLQAHHWPGNVREVENLIYRLAALYAERELTEQAVEEELSSAKGAEPSPAALSLEDAVRQKLSQYFEAHHGTLPPSGLYGRVLETIERPLLELSLEATQGNQLKAADLLGINRNTLRKKIQDLGISPKNKGWNE